MNQSELQLLADHMGHNLAIHTDHYRLQTSLLEKSKVARLLMAVENGVSMNKYATKDLHKISEAGRFTSFT